MKGYTRTGERGETGLYGGTRVGKENPRVEAYGAVDELNSQIGLARAIVKDAKTKKILKTVQEDLFTLEGILLLSLLARTFHASASPTLTIWRKQLTRFTSC